MRRNNRKRNMQDDDLNIKIIKYSAIGVAILAVIVFALLIYSKNLNDEVKEGTLTSEQISGILNKTQENTESASTEIGKSINESQNNIDNSTNTNSINDISSKNVTNTTNANVLTTQNIKSVENTKKGDSETNTKENPEETVELNFSKPVEGDIVKEFAQSNLLFSETLQEWTTHTGIDIKADKTTIVKSAEAGIVKTIKNDPRYGITIVVEHSNGFRTVYSNLLTSEFVIEGEKIKKGQSLGTIGNTAAFEIADDSHLHFEIIKDGVQVDPNIYLK